MASVGTAFNSPHPVRGVDDFLSYQFDKQRPPPARCAVANKYSNRSIQLEMQRIRAVRKRPEKISDIGVIHRFAGIIRDQVLL